jgi:hypothetical protein
MKVSIQSSTVEVETADWNVIIKVVEVFNNAVNSSTLRSVYAIFRYFKMHFVT